MVWMWIVCVGIPLAVLLVVWMGKSDGFTDVIENESNCCGEETTKGA